MSSHKFLNSVHLLILLNSGFKRREYTIPIQTLKKSINKYRLLDYFFINFHNHLTILNDPYPILMLNLQNLF